MSLNMLGMGGGVTKNLDATSAKISAIRKDLERISKLLGQIGGQAGNVNGKVGGAGSSLPSSSMFGGNALFPSTTQVTTAPNFSTAVASKLGPKGVGAAGTVLAVGSTAWNALPNLNDVITQQQAAFQAGLGNANPDYRRMNSMLSNAFGGYASSIGSQQRSAAILSQMGIGNVENKQDFAFMNSLAATSLLTGKSQDQLALDSQALMAPRNKNFLRPYIGMTTSADGRSMDLATIADRIATRSLGANWNQATLDEALRKGFGQSPQMQALGNLAPDAIMHLRTSASHGGKPISSTDQMKAQKLAGKDNPNAISQSALGSQTKVISAYSETMLTAFEKTTSALNSFRSALENSAAFLGPIAAGKAAAQTFSGDPMGNAIGGGMSMLGSTVGTVLGMRYGGKLLGSALGKSAPKAGGSVMSRAGSVASRIMTSANLKSSGKFLGETGGKTMGKSIAGVGIALNAWDGWQNKEDDKGFWGGALTATGTGAVGGGMAGLLAGPAAPVSVPVAAGIGAVTGFLGYAGGYLANDLFGGGAAGDSASSGGAPKTGAGLVDMATGYVGTPYVWGGKSPKGWDCSGFTQYIFKKHGVTLQRTSDQQYRQGTPVHSLAQAQPGDLLFFKFKDGQKKVVNHVGIYMGGGKMVHAAGRKSGTKVASLTKYFLSALVGIRRILGGKAGRSNNNQSNITSGASNMNSRGDAWSDANGSGPATSAIGYGTLAAANIGVSSYGGLSASTSSVASLLATSSSVSALMNGGGASTAVPEFNGRSSGGPGNSADSGAVTVKTNSNSAYTTSTSVLTGNSNAERTFRYLEGKNFTDQSAAGVVGNLMQESGVNPRSQQHGGGPGRGIMQWSVNQRWKQLTNWANKQHRDPWSLGTQLDWMYKEMGSYGVLGKLSGMRDVRGATKYFEDTMEKAGKPNMAARYDFAERALRSYGNDGNVKKYSSGSWAISNDQIAKIHQGEMILPASIAEAVRTSLRSGLQGGSGTSGSGRSVVIQVQIKDASDAEAIALARKVKAILDEDADYKTIGGL